MSLLKESLIIDGSEVRKGLLTVESEMERSAKRQAAAVQKHLGDVGEKSAKQIVKDSRAVFDRQMAPVRVDLELGKIDRAEFKRREGEAKKLFNDLIAGSITAKGGLEKLGEADYSHLARALKSVPPAAGQAARGIREVREESEKATGGFRGMAGGIRTAAAAVAAFVAGSAAVQYLRDSVGAAKELATSYMRLSASAKLFGVDQKQLNDLAAAGRTEFHMAGTEANNLAAISTKMAASAGDAAQAHDLMARALDLGAAQGLTAVEVGEALDQTLRGQDEGLDKLLQKNPSAIYAEYAAAAGKSAAKLTEVEKKQALVNAIVAAGQKVQGEYGRQFETDVGKLNKFQTTLTNMKEMIGASLIPIMVELVEKLEGPLVRATNMAAAAFNALYAAMDPSGAMARAEIDALKQHPLASDPEFVLRRLGAERTHKQEIQRQIDWIDPDDLRDRAATALKTSKTGMLPKDLVDQVTALHELERQAKASGEVIKWLEDQYVSLARTTSNNTTTDSDGTPTDESAQAVKALEERMRVFRGAADRGLSPDAIPPEVQERLGDILALEKEIRETEDAIAQARAGGAALPPGTEEYLAYLEAQRDRAREAGQAIVDLWKTEAPSVAVKLAGFVPFQLKALSTGGGSDLRKQYEAAKAAADRLADAELRLQAARATSNPRDDAEAERAYTTAKKDAQAAVDQYVGSLQSATITDEARKKLLAEIVALLDKLGIKTKDVPGDALAEQAQQLARGARGVLSIADAMGVLDDQTRQALEGVVNLADGLAAVIANPRDIGGWTQLIGGGIGVVASFFDDGAAEQARYEEIAAMAELQDALERLRTTVLQSMSLQKKGEVESTLAPLAEDARKVQMTRFDSFRPGDITAEQIRALKQLEEATGIDVFDESTGSINADRFLEAIEAFEQLDLGAFGQDLEGRLDGLNFELGILGDAAGSAQERLTRFIEALRSVEGEDAEGAKRFADALEGMSAEEAEAWIDGLAKRLAANDQTLFEEGGEFEGLSGDDARRLLEQSQEFIDALGAGGVSRSVQIGQSITEIQANEVIAWLEDMDHWLRQIHDLLAGGVLDAPAAADVAVAVATDPLVDLQAMVTASQEAAAARLAAVSAPLSLAGPETLQAIIEAVSSGRRSLEVNLSGNQFGPGITREDLRRFSYDIGRIAAEEVEEILRKRGGGWG